MPELQERLEGALGAAYRIEKELGGGGMSRVFLAREEALGRHVVVKVLPPEMAAGVNVDRFRREIQLAAGLQHPHVVPLLTAGSAGDLLFYVMPLIEGESLRVRLAREGELPISQTVRILRDVADALAYAHRHSVVHRDIKPDNVLLSGQHAVVTDFGVAKAVSEATGASSLTSVGVALGTPAYMAPEQAAADPHTDHRADIYALGVLAYEMLTGRPPFTASSPQMVLSAQVTQAPEPVTQHRTAVPPALAALVMRCLEKKPADRWQTAEELLHQLEAMATPSGGMEPTGAVMAAHAPPKAKRPSRVAMAVAAGVVLAVVLGVVVWPRLHGRGPSAGGRPMIAVLPFQNLGGAQDEYFADGVTEEITSRLANLRGLGVISRTSANRYKNTTKSLRQIAADLGVQYVLEGTIRWQREAGGPSRVRVSPQLIKVADDTHLWAQTYDEDMTEVFRVQSEIAERVAQALNVALLAPDSQALAAKPTANLEAYDFFLRGRAYVRQRYSTEAVRGAVELFGRAVALDSGFAQAWANLSLGHSRAYWFSVDRTDERMARARAASDRALALAPNLADTHIALGYYHYWGHRDYAPALDELATAIRLQPNNAEAYAAMGYIERRMGRWEEARTHLAQAVTLDPLADLEIRQLAVTLQAMRRFDEAARYLDRAIAIAPDVPAGYIEKAWGYIAADGNVERARQVMRDAAPRFGNADDVVTGEGSGYLPLFRLDSTMREVVGRQTRPSSPVHIGLYCLNKAVLYYWSNRPRLATAYSDSARVVYEGLVRERPDDDTYHVALGLAYAGLGRKAQARHEGERAVELLPVSKDALDGAARVLALAEILIRTGEYDAAIDRLEYLLTIPSSVTRAWLRVDPLFDRLRSNPRFQRLVAGN